jgi:hypothetical protein
MRASTGQHLAIMQVVRDPVSRRYGIEQSVASIGHSGVRSLRNEPLKVSAQWIQRKQAICFFLHHGIAFTAQPLQPRPI